jgi:hypothetical protein
MGSAPNRDLIWGDFGPVDAAGMVGALWSNTTELYWHYIPSSNLASEVPNANGPYADLNLWAFVEVPEPASFVVFGAGLIGILLSRLQAGILARAR